MNNAEKFMLKRKAELMRQEQIRAANAMVRFEVSPEIEMLDITPVRWRAMIQHFTNWEGKLELCKST